MALYYDEEEARRAFNERIKRYNESIIRRARNKNLVAVQGRVRTILSLAVKICKYRDICCFAEKKKLTKEQAKDVGDLREKLRDIELTFRQILRTFSKKEMERLCVLLTTSQNLSAKNYISNYLIRTSDLFYFTDREVRGNIEECADKINKMDGRVVYRY